MAETDNVATIIILLCHNQNMIIVKSKDIQQGFLVNIVAAIVCYNQNMIIVKNKTNKEGYVVNDVATIIMLLP